MVGKVAQIQCLDENGYWLHRSIFMNLDAGYQKAFSNKIIKNKSIPRTYTTIRKVLYV